jgi:rod shape-determining protein MreD
MADACREDWAMSSAMPPGSLVLRLAVLAVAVVFLQIGVVSEVPLFGVVVDLSPLVVGFVGLLCGSALGATVGFAIGLLVDLTLVQTLGLTSLIFTVIGYSAGRLRELRDPQAALTPLLVGAAAAAASMVGYSLMEFMLGVDAPVSFELLRQIVLGVVVDSIVALPVWALVRRWVEPSMPDDPRRRRRRAYTTGGLSPLSQA